MPKVRYYVVTATSRYVGTAILWTRDMGNALEYIKARQNSDYDRFTLTSFSER